MIRRVVEYIIVCDANRVLRNEECPNYSGHAFSSFTQADCAASAEQEGWKRVGKRFWFCPACAKKHIKED